MIGKRFIALALVGIAVFLAAGLLCVLIACSVVDNWLLLLTILFHATALVFPAMCDGYNFEGMPSYLSDSNDMGLFHMRAAGWFLLGSLFLSGYAMPVILFRAHKLTSVKAVYLTIGGGTLIWASIILFMAAFMCKRTSGSDYSYGEL